MERKNHRSLKVWQKAHDMVLHVYKATKNFPADELYGMRSQIRRAAVSVPANIVEGYYRNSNKDKAHFYNISHSSLEEARYLMELSGALGYTRQNGEVDAMFEEISKMLTGLSKSLPALFLATGYRLLAT